MVRRLSPLEGDGFEPSVPHTKQPFWLPRSVPQFAFRDKNRLFRAGTDGSNPFTSREESASPRSLNSRTPISYWLAALFGPAVLASGLRLLFPIGAEWPHQADHAEAGTEPLFGILYLLLQQRPDAIPLGTWGGNAELSDAFDE